MITSKLAKMPSVYFARRDCMGVQFSSVGADRARTDLWNDHALAW